MSYREWSRVNSDGGSFLNKEESTFWIWGTRLLIILGIIGSLWVGLHWVIQSAVEPSFSEVKIKLKTNSLAIQDIQDNMKHTRKDIETLKQNLTDLKVGQAEIKASLSKTLSMPD